MLPARKSPWRCVVRGLTSAHDATTITGSCRRACLGFASSASSSATDSSSASSDATRLQQEDQKGQPSRQLARQTTESDLSQENRPLPVEFRFTTANRNSFVNRLILSDQGSRATSRSKRESRETNQGGQPGGKSTPRREHRPKAPSSQQPTSSSQPSTLAARPRRPRSAAASAAAPSARVALEDLVRQLGKIQSQLDRFGPPPPVWQPPALSHGLDDVSVEAAAQSILVHARAWIRDMRAQVVEQTMSLPTQPSRETNHRKEPSSPPTPPPPQPPSAQSRWPSSAALASAPERPPASEPASVPAPLPALKLASAQNILEDLVRRLEQMQTQLDRFGPLPTVWEMPRSTAVTHDRSDASAETNSILVDARAWIRDLQAQVVDGVESERQQSNSGGNLSVSRHREELGVLLERIMGVFSDAAALPSNPSAVAECFDDCRRVLRLMDSWKLNWQQRHVDCAMVAACRAGLWGEAAELFMERIDPDRGSPRYDVSVSDPMGLYALAMHQQQMSRSSSLPVSDQQATSAVDRVMDAVQRMTMLSPIDKPSYVLAAGTALGRAGEWRGLVNYLNDPSTAERVENLGQSLLAATMHACILCDQHEHAMKVFDQFIAGSDARREWQWGGGEMTELYPLCRDLAMRALGGCRSKTIRKSTSNDDAEEGFSSRALEYYWNAFGEGVTVSLEALCGVAAACETDGRWEDAMSLLFSVLTKSMHIRWIVPGNELSVGSIVEELDFHPDVLPRMGKFASIVMRVCNAHHEFATAVLAFRLVTSSLPHDVHPSGVLMSPSELSESFLPAFSVFQQDKDLLLSELMTSFACLSCPQQSIKLYEEVAGGTGNALAESNRVLETVLRRKDEVATSDWLSVFTRLHHFMIAFQVICVDNGEELTDGEARLMSSVLALIVSSCTKASQPQTGVKLATWVDLHVSSSEPYLPATDSLVAALIDAHSACGNYDAALDVLHKQEGRLATRCTGVLTSISAIKLLFRVSRVSEALALFDAVIQDRQSPDLMSAVASGLVHVGDWHAVTEVYRLAAAKGCLSEELGLLTIKSFREMGIEGRYRTMRNIAEDVAKVVGVTQKEWIESKYWKLKRLLGFSTAARLMMWGDPATRHLDELNFALHSIEKRKLEGRAPKSATLRLVVSAARSFRTFEVPEGKNGLALLPKDTAGWIRILKVVAAEANHCSLNYDQGFVESMALSFKELGSFEDAARVIDEATDRGLDVYRSVLYT